MGLKTLVLALSIGLLATACSSGSSGSNGNGGGGNGGGIFGGGGGNNPAPVNNQTGTGTQGTLVGACGMKVNSPNAQNVVICTDYFNQAGGQLTQDKVEQACTQQQGQMVQGGCPTSNVTITGVCQVTAAAQGYSVAILIYNDSNAADLQQFANSCQQQGGKLN